MPVGRRSRGADDDDLARRAEEIEELGPYVGLAREIRREVERLTADGSADLATLADAIGRFPEEERARLVHDVFDRLSPDVQWAVLAACSTASGSTHAYEGLYGLARAFRLAGARTVLLSLWPVDDDATAQWSEALYLSRLRDDVDTPTAMQHAQRAVLAARRANAGHEHPYYWAGFFALGDWR